MTDDGPRSSRTRALLAGVTTVLLASALVAGGVVVRRQDDAARDATRRPATSSPDATTPAPPGSSTVEDVVPALQGFVEEKRGLRFRHPVGVTLLDDAAFEARLVEDEVEEAREEAARYTGLFRALRLIPPGVDLYDKARQLAAGSVVGFYVPKTDELVVRGTAPTPYVRQVVVHELVHALQHQHFDIDRPELEDADDSEVALGFEALVEGDASRIDLLYLETLTTEERIAAVREERARADAVDDSDVPEAVGVLFGFTHGAGPGFVDAVVRDGGQAALDRAFSDPPTTVEQVLHPEKYLRREPIRPVAAPRADGAEFDRGVFGELGFQLVLGQLVSRERAAVAADGWGGDRYVAWTEGERVCVRVSVVSDTAGDELELRDALARWTAQHGSARIEAGRPVTVRACE